MRKNQDGLNKMFGFKKKKKKAGGGGGSNPSSASNSPASVKSVEKKPSKVSRLPFGWKSHKPKSETGSISSLDIPISHGVSNESISSRTSDLPPAGYIVLGKLASDLEALQVSRDSKETATEAATEITRTANKSQLKNYELRTVEDWGEQEVSVWLIDNNLAYFVELFEGCDIDGDYLLNITEDDLVELEVDDSDLRNRLLQAINDLINTQEDDNDDVDLSLPGLDDEGSENEWESLSGELDDYNDETKDQPRSEKGLDIFRPPTGFSEGHQSRLGKTIDEWTKDDVIVWLESIKLGKYSKHFLDHQVTGSKLKNIDMSLLDQMKMDSSEDRERFLSSLYEASNRHNVSPLLLGDIDEVSEYEKQKYLAAVSVMQSTGPSVQLLPAEPLGEERRDCQDGMCSAGSDSDSNGSDDKEKKKKKGSFTKLRDALTGMSKNPSLVRVWTDIGAAKDKPVRLKLEIEESDESKDLINLCLESLNMVEDPRLYCIAEVCVADSKDHSTVTDRELNDSEKPLKVRRNWSENLSGHFELRQRTAQGGVIKLVLKLPDEKPKGKLVALSLSTPACELIHLAMMKYGLSNAKDFCLLEVDSNGDLHNVEEDTLLLQQESHAYVLCKKESKAELMAIAKADSEQGQERTDSQSSMTSLQSEDILVVKVDGEKLTQLEKEMASIEKSLLPKVGRSVSWSVNNKNNAHRKVMSLSKCEDVGDGTVNEKLQYLEEENRKLKERLKEVESMEEVFNKLKVTLRRLNTENNLKLLERKRAANPDLDSLPRELAAPMFQLEGITQQVEAKQAKIDNMRRETDQVERKDDNYLLEEASLVALKLEQTRLLCTMEVAMADYQMSCAKRKEMAESRSLVTILPPNKQFIIVTVIVNAGAEGYTFELGSSGSRKGIYISKCGPEDSMKTGDRIIEINNHSTFTSSVAEGHTKLNSTSKVKLVILREIDDEDSIETAKHKQQSLLLEITQLKLALDTAKNESSPQNNHHVKENDLSNILENLDDDVPLWEAIKCNTKSEILQVFQEEIQEANRQKQYLDQLYTLMLERAPELLEEMEQDVVASDISGDEEFC